MSTDVAMSGRGLGLRGRRVEDVGAEQFQELATCGRNPGVAPLADRWRPDATHARDCGSSAKAVDDFGIGWLVHSPKIGQPIDYCNRLSYSALL